jgi:hypothetical protein
VKPSINVVGYVAIVLLFLFLVPIVPGTLPFCKGGPVQGYSSVTLVLFNAGVAFYGGAPHLLLTGFPFCE